MEINPWNRSRKSVFRAVQLVSLKSSASRLGWYRTSPVSYRTALSRAEGSNSGSQFVLMTHPPASSSRSNSILSVYLWSYSSCFGLDIIPVNSLYPFQFWLTTKKKRKMWREDGKLYRGWVFNVHTIDRDWKWCWEWSWNWRVCCSSLE